MIVNQIEDCCYLKLITYGPCELLQVSVATREYTTLRVRPGLTAVTELVAVRNLPRDSSPVQTSESSMGSGSK